MTEPTPAELAADVLLPDALPADAPLAVEIPPSAPHESAPPTSALVEDPQYRAAVVDLLAVLAYGELMAFERLAADAAMAPTVADKSALAGMATA